MPFLKVYIHFVWSTKNRYPFLHSQELRAKVWQHIKENALKKGIFVDFVNGYDDHCHCLVSLGTDNTIQKTMQLIKGESSFWINTNKLTKEKFEWQDEYFGVSVSESMIDKVRNYIKNQEEHHKKKTFDDEYNDFILKYGFEKFNIPSEDGGNSTKINEKINRNGLLRQSDLTHFKKILTHFYTPTPNDPTKPF